MEAQFPGSAHALRAVADVIRRFRIEMARDHRGLELEARLGRVLDSGAVETSVSVDDIDDIMQLVQNGPNVRVDDWVEFEDFFFDIGSTEHRCRVQYDTERLNVNSEIVVKKRLVGCQLRSQSTVLRVVLSRETVVDPRVLPDTVVPKHTRIHQRKTVYIRSRGLEASPRDTWLVQFGAVWSGKTRVDAETSQMAGQGDARYVVEVELNDPEYVTRHSDEYVACSLVMKSADFLSHDALFCVFT